MFTRMAKLLLLLAAAMLFSGAVLPTRLPALGAAILAWVLLEWLLFHVALLAFDHRVSCRREFAGPPCLPTAWRDQEITVSITLVNRSWFGFPHLEVREIVPPHLAPAAGSCPERWRLALAARETRTWSYTATARRVGYARFPGVACRAVSLGGLFLADRFLETAGELRIYPPVAGGKDQPALVKSYNEFRHHGIHVYRKGGTGSELLELRDYVPGDPPQTIAWRPSARREELITRVFESEVPMRITLFLDGSASMRVGTDRTHFEIATDMLGEFARVALANRDWVGLTLVDEAREEVVRPGRGRAQLLSILDLLARHGNLSPGQAIGDLEGLTGAVESYARVRFPLLWEAPFNRAEGGFFTLRSRPEGTRATRVKRLALVAASHLGEGPEVVADCLARPEALAGLLARFAMVEGLRLARGFSEEVLALGERTAGKLAVLERSLRYAVGRARDNELFVLLVDFAGLADRLDPVIEALRLARQKHHAVLALSPWLAEYFPEPDAAPGLGTRTRILTGPFGAGGSADPLELLDRLTYQRYVRGQEEVRARFLGAGLPFATVRAPEALARLLRLVTRLRLNQGVMT
ncbi:MAG: DUF58 domain-containing protein [Planctomycetes bacterium]|nr:DUF58 domain-containing protein [Planctomycetota bacterium]